MEGKLIKENDFYMLEVRHKRIGDMIIASSDHDFSKIINHRFKLSTKNCQSIENGYDLDDKISKHLEKNDIEASAKRVQVIKELIFELLGDKKFSEEQLKDSLLAFISEVSCEDGQLISKTPVEAYEWIENHVQSLQQTEWDVEVETRYSPIHKLEVFGNNNIEIHNITNEAPKLDEDGCLILRRK